MSDFIYAAKLRGETITDVRLRLRKSLDELSRKRLQIGVTIDRPTFCLFVCRKRHSRKEQIVQYDDGGFAAVVGTLIYKNRFGVDALNSLYRDFQANGDVFSHLLGSFAAFVSRSDQLYCFNDFNGTYHIFSDLNMQVVSSSMLAVLGSVSGPRVSRQALYEYLLDGATYGADTPIQEVRRLSHASVHQLQPQLKLFPKLVASLEMPLSFDDQVRTAVSDLLAYFQILHTHFAGSLLIAFSGGYDSRLLLAAAIHVGFEPQTFVGGYEASSDVRVARTITTAEGIGLVHQDPSRHPKISICDFPQIVDEQFHYYDGLGIRGAVTDGCEYEFRQARLGEGMLELNGSGGEHYRDFWQLQQSPIKVHDFVRKALVFKSFDIQAALTQQFRREEYSEFLAEKIRSAIPVQGDRLSEKQVSALYTFFRSTYFAGPSTKEVNLFGYSLLPFAETPLVLRSYCIPMHYKRYGRFEAEMINRLNPRLASYPSSYGYNFHDPISLLRRYRTNLIRLSREFLPLPIVFAAYKRLKRGKLRMTSPYCHESGYLESIVDLRNLRIAEYFDLEKIRKLHDPTIFSRALTLELLLRKL